MSDERFTVEDRPAESRYVLIDRTEEGTGTAVIGEESYVDLERDGAMHRIFYHTAVSDEYRGQGLASVLVRAAVEHAVSTGRFVVPVCPYVVTWFKKHEEYAKHEVKATPDHLNAVRDSQG